MNDIPEEATQAGVLNGAPDETAPAKDRDSRKRDQELLATERICRIIDDDVPEEARDRVTAYIRSRYAQAAAPGLLGALAGLKGRG